MSKMTMEIRTDENGYFSKTLRFNAAGLQGSAVVLSATLTSPAATGIWSDIGIDVADDKSSNPKRAFVAWHHELVVLGSWVLDAEDNIIVVNGKTRPARAYTRLVLEIEVTA